MYFRQIYEPKLAQNAYLIGCQETQEAIIIDPQRDIDRYIKAAETAELKIAAVAETHIHADYLGGMREFAHRYGIAVYASDEGDEDWKYEWLENSDYNYNLVKHGDSFSVGNIHFTVLHTPGHTPEHISFLVTDKGGDAGESRSPMGILSGDFVFVNDVGRPDLLETAAGKKNIMEPSARTLFRSIQDFKALSPFLQVWPCHGAGSACGKALGAVPMSTVGYELKFNPSILAADTEDHFVDFILEGQPEPPMYFARMKRDNKVGPSLLGTMPEPKKITSGELNDLAGATDIAVIDARPWDEFKDSHIPGSLSIPLNDKFNTVAGSYIDEKTPLYLVIDEDKYDEAVTDLIRIGLDKVIGWIPVETFQKYASDGGETRSTKEIDIRSLDDLRSSNDLFLLDVRRESELAEVGHIDGAYNIAYTRFLSRMDEIPKEKTIALYCRAGIRSAHASSFLERNGYNVLSLGGGIEAWINAGKKVVV